MKRDDQVSERVTFGEFELDLDRKELFRRGERIPLQRRRAEALALLVEKAGEPVTREALAAHLWGDTIVEYDKSINPIIRNLRSVLGDSGERGGFIETIRGVGYRFALPKSEEPVAGSPPPAEVEASRSPSPRRLVAPVAMVVLASMVSLAIVLSMTGITPFRGSTAEAGSVRVAVVPFAVDAELGLEEDAGSVLALGLSTALARLDADGMTVVAYDSWRHGAPDEPLTTVAADIQASHLVTGRVTGRGEAVHLAIELVDMEAMTYSWTGSRRAELLEDLVTRGDLAGEIARELGTPAVLDTAERDSSYLVLQSVYYTNRGGFGDAKRGIELAREATVQRPESADGWAALGFAFHRLWTITGQLDWAEQAAEATHRALELDPRQPRAVTVATSLAFFHERSPERGRELLALGESVADGEALYHFLRMNVELAQGEMDAAIASAERAGELAPMSMWINVDVDWLYYGARRPEEALERSAQTLELFPRYFFNHLLRAICFQEIGDHSAAAEEARLYLEKSRKPDWEVESVAQSAALGDLAPLFGIWLADQQLTAQRYSADPVLMALAFAGVKDRDMTISWLERADEDRAFWLFVVLPSYPLFDFVRDDPRFRALVDRQRAAVGVVPLGPDA